MVVNKKKSNKSNRKKGGSLAGEMLNRSNTWPVVVVRLEDGKAATKLDANCNERPGEADLQEVGGDKTSSQADKKFDLGIPDTAPRLGTLDPKKTATLNRHYYLEGGWGWVIVTVSCLVHILCHGLQMSSAVILQPAATKFDARISDAGMGIWIAPKNRVDIMLESFPPFLTC
ncbi:hypothetical protein LSTR_LSTR002491 [Laodelphax striatellus]|uniref:Monocarboxylate transporter n=1 Tax=Laodelphax striatellus TaxID=195883 RepID=A0A482X3I2_LAOST|nr:hypothetical protein LSTR_LSTR002491 [Laodelphax striatellus]